jgi:hypothetical protein
MLESKTDKTCINGHGDTGWVRMIPNQPGGRGDCVIDKDNELPDLRLTHSCIAEWTRARSSFMGWNSWIGKILESRCVYRR